MLSSKKSKHEKESVSKKKLVLSSFYALTAIFVIQLFVFYPTRKLSLFGDDWLAFWRFETIVNSDPYQQGYNYLTYFLTPYGPQDVTMGIISKLFGYEALPYYIISFLLRFVLVVVVYFTTLKFFKNQLAAFASSAFISITITGLETTNWVFNMPSYLGVTFFVGFIYFFFLSFQKDELKNLLKGYFLLFFALVIVPIRMHGVIPMVLMVELLWLMKNRYTLVFKKALLRIPLVILVFWIVKQVGNSFGSPQETIDRITGGINLITNLFIKEGTEEVVLFPIATFGNMIFPEVLWDKVDDFFKIPFLGRPRPFVLLSSLLFGTYIYLAAKLKNRLDKKEISVFGFVGVTLNLLVYVFYKLNPITFSSIPSIGATLIGFYTISFYLLLVYFKHIDRKFHVFTLTVLSIPILFMLLPWFMASYTIFPANHRYTIVSAIGVSLLFGILFITKINRKTLLIILTFFLFVNGCVSKMYFDNLVQKRDVEISNKIWTVVHSVIPKYDGQRYHVVYFEGDGNNGDVIHNNVFFGYPPRSSIEQKIINKDDIPVAITTYDDLVNMVINGGSLVAHAKEPEKLPIERVYAFRITGNSAETVIVLDITEKIRNKLKEEIKSGNIIKKY